MDQHRPRWSNTRAEVAQLVGADSSTIYRWASTYTDLPVLRVGGVVRFHRERLLAWLEAHEQGVRAQAGHKARSSPRKVLSA